MTNPPQSPYGPADPGQTPPQQPYQQQPPYNAAQYYPQEQAPYGYTVVGPTGPKRTNGPGLAALIIGIVAVVTAFIPFVNFFAFVLGPAGIIVGIIGLVLAERPRKQAAWGTSLSAVSMVIAFIMIFVYTFGLLFAVGGAVDEATRDLPTASPLVPASPDPDVPASDPVPRGTVVELTDADGASVFAATVTASVLDANDEVLAVSGNTEPPAGMQWAMATLEISPTAGSNLAPDQIEVAYVTATGEIFDTLDAFAVPPPEDLATVQDELEVGETGTGNVVVAIPIADATNGFWSVRYGDQFSGSVPHLFEAQ